MKTNKLRWSAAPRAGARRPGARQHLRRGALPPVTRAARLVRRGQRHARRPGPHRRRPRLYGRQSAPPSPAVPSAPPCRRSPRQVARSAPTTPPPRCSSTPPSRAPRRARGRASRPPAPTGSRARAWSPRPLRSRASPTSARPAAPPSPTWSRPSPPPARAPTAASTSCACAPARRRRGGDRPLRPAYVKVTGDQWAVVDGPVTTPEAGHADRGDRADQLLLRQGVRGHRDGHRCRSQRRHGHGQRGSTLLATKARWTRTA